MKSLICLLFLPLGLLAQGPSCTWKGTFTTATTSTPNANNTGNPNCNAFALTWNSTGFSALSIQLEGADVIGGPYTAFSGSSTVLVGTNPATSLSGAILIQASSALAYIRVNLVSATGSGGVNWQIFGYNGVTSAVRGASGGGGGGTQTETWTAGTGGVTAGQVVCASQSGSPTTAVTCPVASVFNQIQESVIGIAQGSAIAGASFQVIVRGPATCAFDSLAAPTAGHLAIYSLSLNGSCQDSAVGGAGLFGIPIVGVVMTTGLALTTQQIYIYSSGLYGSNTIPISPIKIVQSGGGLSEFRIQAGNATSAQGTGTKLQFSTGSPVSGNCAQFDATGNTVDAGQTCGAVVTPLWTASGTISSGTLVCISASATNTIVECPTTTGATAPTVLGIAQTSGGTGTPIGVATNGGVVRNCVFDNTAVIGDIVTISTTTPGDCSDSGFTAVGQLALTAPYVGTVQSAGTGSQSIMFVSPGANGAQQSATTLTSHTISVPLGCVAASASGTAYTCSTSPTFVPAAGDIVYLKADVANTGSATLAVNGASAAVMKKNAGGTNLSANDLLIGSWMGFTFDGTNWQMQGEAGTSGTGGTCAALGGDLSGTCLTASVIRINGGSVPASANLISTNVSSQPVASTAHNVSAPLQCSAAGASGTAYTCSTSPTFVPAGGDVILFCPDVANTGTATLVVNGQAGTPAIQKQQGQAALVANDLRASPACVTMEFNGTNWVMQGQLGNLPISLTTTGTSGPATLSAAGVLNVPQYSGGSGSFSILESHTASSSANLSFTTCLGTSGFDSYEVDLSGLLPATNGVTASIRFSTNGGSTYDNSASYDWSMFRVGFGGTTSNFANAGVSGTATQMDLPGTPSFLSNSAANGLSGYLRIYNTTSTGSVHTLIGNFTWFDNTGSITNGLWSGGYAAGAAINAFQVFMSSGNIASGTVRCYGIHN